MVQLANPRQGLAYGLALPLALGPWAQVLEAAATAAVGQDAGGPTALVAGHDHQLQFGQPVLMQEVLQELDPSLEPIMSRAVVKVGNRSIIKLGDKEVDYNPDFKFYLTTKLANPHYTPEISTKATIVNFCVKQQGLEDQLLGTVVKKERPELETQKNELVVAVAAGTLMTSDDL